MTAKRFYDWQTAGGTDDVMRLVNCLERADIPCELFGRVREVGRQGILKLAAEEHFKHPLERGSSRAQLSRELAGEVPF